MGYNELSFSFGFTFCIIETESQTVNAQYYVEKILDKTCFCGFKRRGKTEPVHMRKMVSKRSEAHFMQDEAPTHRANVTQEWCRRHFNRFWTKEEWPGNSPDLNLSSLILYFYNIILLCRNSFRSKPVLLIAVH